MSAFSVAWRLLEQRRGREVDWLASIDTPEQWELLRSRPDAHSVAHTESVKCVIDLQRDNRTYFLNSVKWTTHYDFVLRFINPTVDFNLFVISEYKRDDRRFMLASVMHYLDGESWTIELDPGDLLDAVRIEWMYRHLAPRLGVADDLRFRPASPAQIALVERLGARLPSLSRDAINAAIQYQPIVLGVAYGFVRWVEGELDPAAVRPYDIVVVDHVPEAIPPVAALVTAELQAPLAHVAVLSRNRNTPDMALCSPADLQRLRDLEGELVRLTVRSQDYAVERAERAAAEQSWATLRPATPFQPEGDLLAGGFFDATRPQAGVERCIGTKAAQVATLGALPGIETPGGFALPFSAYAGHLRSAGLDTEIEAMLGDPRFRDDAALRGTRLAQLRAAIVAHPVESGLLAALQPRLPATMHGQRWILRSSTNAEDLPGFNGAGLYESIALPAEPNLEQIADTLRQVWASVWLQRAFEEREWYRIDHRCVAMGVLAQPFVENAIATGVAITGNPFNARTRDVFINSQVRGATVTGAAGNQLPEQYLVVTWTGELEPELLCRSSLTGGRQILAEEDVLALTRQLLRIHDAMLPRYAGHANAMDVEFAFLPDRRFVILQARPYTMVDNRDQSRTRRRATLADRVTQKLRRMAYRLGHRR